MAFSYDPAAGGVRDTVRLLVGDITADAAQLSDEELDLLIAGQADAYLAAAQVCEALAGRFAQVAQLTIDGVSVDQGRAVELYHALAQRYRAQSRRNAQAAGPVGPAGASVQGVDP